MTWMITLILPILTVVLPLFGFGPRIVLSSSARNTTYNVQMWSGEFNGRGNYGPAVLAQEVCEWWLRWAIGLLIGTPLALVGLLAFDMAFGYAPFIQFFGCFWTLIFARTFDSIGHNIEIIVAKRENILGYADEEIQRLKGDSVWQGMDENEIFEQLRSTYWVAELTESIFRRDWAELQGNLSK